jgi:hypothetical protein
LNGAWSLRSAYLVGPDGRPVAGTVACEGGMIVCKGERDQPIGLALLVDAGPAGRLVLQTCFLPSQDEPYELFIEVARWLIKQFVMQSEAWQMWNPAISGDALTVWDRAREQFRAALRCETAPEAERVAREAIALGVAAAEKLTGRHADHLLKRRYALKPASATALGVCVDPAIAPRGAAAAAAKQFDVIALHTPWKRIEIKPGKRDFAAVDAWVQWCRQERKPFVLGPLIDFGPGENGVGSALPDHALAHRSDAKKLRELVWAHAHAVAERYQNETALFVTVSGANLPSWRAEGIERMLELVRTATVAVREVKRTAKTIIEIQSPIAEGWCGAKGAAWPTSFLQRVVGENLGLSAVGVRVVEGVGRDPVRELLTVADMLDGYLGRDLPVFVSGFGVPSAGDAGTQGSWRGAWSAEHQAQWGVDMLRISLARSWIEGAWWSRLQDAVGASDGVIDANGQPKPALGAMLALRRGLNGAAKREGAGGAEA